MLLSERNAALFEYEILEEGQDKTPTGDTDGYIQLIFSSNKNVVKDTVALSNECSNAIVFACFKIQVNL